MRPVIRSATWRGLAKTKKCPVIVKCHVRFVDNEVDTIHVYAHPQKPGLQSASRIFIRHETSAIEMSMMSLSILTLAKLVCMEAAQIECAGQIL